LFHYIMECNSISYVVIMYWKNVDRTIFYTTVFSFLFCLFLFCPSSIQADDTLLEPPRNKTINDVKVQGAAVVPDWMLLWNRARSISAAGDMENGANLYRELLIKKPNIEEALREYLLLLMDLDKWEESGLVVQKLLESDSTSLEYLLYGGRIALRQKHYERAAKYLGQVYTTSPNGSWPIEALRGQIVALQRLERYDMAYPLLEQLYLIIPHDERIIRQLAQYSKKQGNKDKALTYYTTLIDEFGGNDTDFLESIPLFEAADNKKMLVTSWIGYLQYHPYYLPFHQKLSLYYLENDLDYKALPHLLVRIAYGEETPLLFLQTGRLFLYEQGRPDKALHYYEEYRQRVPSDSAVISEIKRIQAILANDLLVIVENEGAWTLWRDLAKVIPDRLAVYYSIAKQLDALGKEKELLEVLEIIHLHNQEDAETLFKLAELYAQSGNFFAANKSLDSLVPAQQNGEQYYLLRATIAEKQMHFLSSLQFYKKYLTENSSDHKTLLKGIELAAKIGSIEELNLFYSLLPEHSSKPSIYIKGSFLYGKGLIQNNLFSAAAKILLELHENPDLMTEERKEINRLLLLVFQGEGNFFEAEQFLRLRLKNKADKEDTLQQLIRTSLLSKDWDTAWKWYEYLVLESGNTDLKGTDTEKDLFLEKITLLKVSGQGEVALEILEDFLGQTKGPCTKEDAQCLELLETMVNLYYHEAFYKRSMELVESLLSIYPDDIRLQAYHAVLEIKMGDKESQTVFTDLLHKSSIELIEFAFEFYEIGAYATALRLCESYLVDIPDSLRGRVLQARLLRLMGDEFAALEKYNMLSNEYPDEYGFKQNFLELQFQTAHFTDIIEVLAPSWKSVASGETSLSVRKAVPEVESLPVRQQLLLARSFWAAKRFDDSLLLYHDLLRPAVQKRFFQQLDDKEISIRLPTPEKSLLNIMTFTTPAKPNLLKTVMSPEYTREFLQSEEVKIASTLYSNYRWQQIVANELSVRKAMVDGNYYQAMNGYQEILQNDQSPENLYDLAGIYSRLGFLGKEAALYEAMKEGSPGYPDLDEASNRNDLKRLPRIEPFFFFNKKDGRQGYFNIKQRAGGLQAWFMPTFNHEVSFDVSRIYAESLDVDHGLWRNHLKAKINWSPIYDLDFIAALGGENTDNNQSTLLYDFKVNGRIGDGVKGYLGLSQDIVNDTVEAISVGINAREYKAGIHFDLMPRLFGGADYLFTDYSDGNNQNRYDFWSSYIIHSEPTLLQFKYGYEYSHNDDSNLQKNYNELSGFDSSDHPYWSPNKYWQHLFTLSFEHQLAEDILGRGAPSYYKLEYSFGYEIGGYDNHEASAQIFVEMSRHFLLNSRLELTHGTDIQQMDIFCSLIYRW